MRGFLLETYLPRAAAGGGDHAATAVRSAAEALSREGTPIRYVRSTFLPDDETCFHFLDAASAETVAEVGRRAGLTRARVAAAVDAGA